MIEFHFAYVFNFNFLFCLQIVGKNGYIEKLVTKAALKNEDTIKKMNEIVEIVNSYIDKKGRNKLCQRMC